MGGDVTSCAGCGDFDPLTGKWVSTAEAPFGQWACENCPHGGELHPYAARITDLYLLMKGGFPFGPDDIDVSDRMILGAVEVSMRRRELAETLQAIMGKNDQTP